MYCTGIRFSLPLLDKCIGELFRAMAKKEQGIQIKVNLITFRRLIACVLYRDSILAVYQISVSANCPVVQGKYIIRVLNLPKS